jgi:signal transduction histidine kinase
MGNSELRCVLVRAVESHPGVVRFEVEDSGPGIPEATRARVFEPYFQSGAGGGIGLGLATVERLIQAHGGHVGALPGKRSGTVFWFDLPMTPATISAWSLAPHPTGA